MQSWNIAAAREAIAAIDLTPSNQEIAHQWLALWDEGRPPAIGDFDTPFVVEHEAAIAIFEIHQNRALRCVRAGENYRAGVGFDLTGLDILSITTVVEREARLSWCWQIVEGAVSISYRSIKLAGGATFHAQELSLPFSDRTGDDARFFFMHSNWRPHGADWIEGSVTSDLQTPPSRVLKIFGRQYADDGVPAEADGRAVAAP